MKWTSILLFCAVAIGCGGGGGGSSSGGSASEIAPTDVNQDFSLAKYNSTEVGPVYSLNIEGIDSNSTTYSGSIRGANREQIMLDGLLVTPHESLLNLAGGGTSITSTATSYVDSSGLLVSMFVRLSGVTCTSVSPDRMPDSVKIGDFGTRSTLVCDDDTTIEANWRVEDGRNGTIELVTASVTKNIYSEIIFNSEVIYTIDSAGDLRKAVLSQEDFVSGYSMTLSST